FSYSTFSFDKIKIVDDTMDDMNIIKSMINKTEYQENAFYIADIGEVIKKHEEWLVKLPRVIPHFAIKANSDPTLVIKVLAALNACFDCASVQEIKQVMGDRIIFAHPTKYSSHIEYVRKVGLEIYQMFPCVIRIRCDSKFTSVILGEKFSEETYLIQLTKDLGSLRLNLHGFSFHVDSPGVRCQEFDAYARGIALCKQLVTVSKAIGCDKVQLIDIGGRFPGERGTDIDKFASIINDAQEIAQVMQYDVQGERIIFAHPNKLPSHIEYSRNVGVERMTVDSEFELTKIKELFPEAKVVIRIRCDSKNSPILLGAKFGCDPCKEAAYLIQCAQDLGLNLHGFSFHVGTPCLEIDAYLRGIEICKQLIAVAKSIGCNNVKLIDIGGGFSSVSGKELDELAKLINDAIENLDPDISVISEPGRYYVDSSFTLASYLHSKRLAISDDGKTRRMYYMNCGVYNSFLDELLGLQARVPESPNRDEKFLSNIWGPTADSYDLILKDVLLPEFHIGDWLVWRNMGAYTLTLSNTFNGFPIPTVRPFIRESQWLMSLYLHKRYAIYLKYILNCIVI
ncbi:DCOR2 decarboxylase, partial [Acromyrmex charruanus]